MINEEKLKKFVTSKCYELLGTKKAYETTRAALVYSVDNYMLGTSDFLSRWLSDLRSWEIKYIEQDYTLSQFCHQLGDEYVEIWNKIVEDKNE